VIKTKKEVNNALGAPLIVSAVISPGDSLSVYNPGTLPATASAA